MELQLQRCGGANAWLREGVAAQATLNCRAQAQCAALTAMPEWTPAVVLMLVKRGAECDDAQARGECCAQRGTVAGSYVRWILIGFRADVAIASCACRSGAAGYVKWAQLCASACIVMRRCDCTETSASGGARVSSARYLLGVLWAQWSWGAW